MKIKIVKKEVDITVVILQQLVLKLNVDYKIFIKNVFDNLFKEIVRIY